MCVSTLKLSSAAMYLTTNGDEFCGVYRFVVANSREEERFLTERRDPRGCMFVQQKCRIVAELSIEHASSFLMGFLCPTYSIRYDPRVCHHNFVRFVFWNSSEKNFTHFM